MKRRIIITAIVYDDRDRSGDGIDSIIGVEQSLIADLACLLSGSSYNMKPATVDAKIEPVGT